METKIVLMTLLMMAIQLVAHFGGRAKAQRQENGE